MGLHLLMNSVLILLGNTKDCINDALALPYYSPTVVSDGQCSGGIHTAAGTSPS